MSTSGIYNYWPKVQNPSAILPQMASDTEQRPFYFGGSQVPLNLGIHTGSGIQTKYVSHVDEIKNIEGKGIHTTVKKNNKIYLPKVMKYY